jgi:hypothetical protein
MKLSDQDKIQQQRLIGYANTGEYIILNGELLEILSPMNVYVMNASFQRQLKKEFNQEAEDPDGDPHQDLHESLLQQGLFGQWLVNSGDARYGTASEAGLIYIINRYHTFPFYPSYKDVMWVVRVLRQHWHSLNPNDVYLLAVYRETVIQGRDVKQTLISRDMSQIQSLIQSLQIAHESHTTAFKQIREELPI